jgi:hypothetical protein
MSSRSRAADSDPGDYPVKMRARVLRRHDASVVVRDVRGKANQPTARAARSLPRIRKGIREGSRHVGREIIRKRAWARAIELRRTEMAARPERLFGLLIQRSRRSLTMRQLSSAECWRGSLSNRSH